MKRILSTLLALAMLLTVNTYIYAAEKSDDNSKKIICQATLDDDFADDCVIVVIDKSNSKVNKLFTKKQFKGVSLENIKDLTYFESDPDDLQYLNQEEFKQVLKLDLVKTGKEEVLKAIRKLEKLDFVLAAEPDYYFSPTDLGYEELNLADEADLSEGTEASGYDEELSGETGEPSSDLSEEDLLSDTEEPSENDSEAELQEEGESYDDSSLTPLSTTPNDPQYTAGNQWGLNMINAPQAWDITTGSSSVLVGVIDSGLANHPDMTANVRWDLAWDFINNNNIVTDDEAHNADGSISPHGTMVASVIGAKGNNSTGVSGVCWDVGIVPLQVTDPDVEKSNYISSAVTSAVNYAINNNIPILNCSFGNYGTTNSYATAMSNYNGLIVCSAGNDNKNTDNKSHVPSGLDFDNIISVAASKVNSAALAESADWSSTGESNVGSNYGTATVDIAAPGTSICVAAPTWYASSGYMNINGTSLAAPFVSGVAALILSIRPDLTGTQLKHLLLAYASGYSELQGKVGNNGAYLNAYAALNGAINDTVLVTFNGNGGTANTQSRYYVKGLKYSELPSATRSGCTFYGWYRDGSQITEDTIVSNSNHTLDAMWRVLIAYYLGDIEAGDSEHISTYHVFGQSKTITLNTYAKDGYKLANWIDNDGNEYTPGSTLVITRKMNFYADWEELYSKLSYETTHFDPITPDTVYYTDTLSYQNKIPASSLYTPIGAYILQGWRIKGGDGTVYIQADSDALLDFRSYIFEEAGVGERPFGNVVYDANGGQNAPSNQMRLGENYLIVITNDEPTRQGYSFLGWSDTSDGEVSYAPGSTCSGPSYTTLYAKWAEDCFVVRFGTGTDDDDSAQAYNPPLSLIYEIRESQQDSGITIPDETPTRPSYRFKGWSYTYNGTTTVYQPGDTFILPSAVLTAYDSDGGNIVRLTPVWEKIPSMHPEDFPDEQLMAFVDLPEYGGVTDSTYLRTFTRGETYGDVYVPGDTTQTPAFPVPEEQVVSIDGVRYYFDGWADAAGNIIDEDTPVSKEGFHYIYARWIEEADYTDVTQGSVNSKYISRCRHYGYMSGTSTTTFSPSEDVSRAIATYVLYRFEGSPLYGNNKFFDVETYKANGDSDPVSEAISWATENSIAFPIDINEFGTENAITREQLVTLIYRYVKYKGVDVSDVDETCLDDFDDQDQISAYADDAMIWAVSKGIITGAVDLSGNTVLAPQGEVTRDQLAILIVRMRNLLIDNDKITTLKNGTVNSNADTVGNLSETLSENSWEAIDLASDAGVSETVWSVGDEKNVTLTTGETVTVQIYDFNHDDLTAGGKAGITFGLKNSMMNARAMNSTNTNANSFVGTTMYTWLNGALYNSMPEDLKNIVKQTDKKTAVSGESSQIQTDSMKIFLFSESECFGTNFHCTSGEGTQYAIFTDDASRIKIQEGPQIIEWWLRSPRLTDSTSFGIVHATGHSGYTSASWEYAGVCFGFCV